MRKLISITKQNYWEVKRCPICKNINVELQDLNFDIGNVVTTVKLCDECIKVLSKEINEYLEVKSKGNNKENKEVF